MAAREDHARRAGLGGPGHDRHRVRHRMLRRIDDGYAPAEPVDVDAIGDFEDVGHVVADQHDRQAAGVRQQTAPRRILAVTAPVEVEIVVEVVLILVIVEIVAILVDEVVIVNLNGSRHLRACLRAARICSSIR